MLTRWLGLPLVTITFTAVGCDDPKGTRVREVPLEDAAEHVVRDFCGPMFACECPNGRPYASRAECEASARQLVDAYRAEASVANLTYDPQCVGQWLEDIESQGCSARPLDDSEQCVSACRAFHGDKPVGAQCQFYSYGLHDCAQGLVCAGVCQDPCGDDSNLPQQGEQCASGVCAAELYCDFSQPVPVCQARPGPGEACFSDECQAGLFCELVDPQDPATWRCKAVGEVGEPCSGHNQCATGYCPAGSCRELPQQGESCRGTFVCDAGLVCREEICVDSDPLICGQSIAL
jgi:hypothetical protein